MVHGYLVSKLVRYSSQTFTFVKVTTLKCSTGNAEWLANHLLLPVAIDLTHTHTESIRWCLQTHLTRLSLMHSPVLKCRPPTVYCTGLHPWASLNVLQIRLKRACDVL